MFGVICYVLDVVDVFGWDCFFLIGYLMGVGIVSFIVVVVFEWIECLVVIEVFGGLCGLENEIV